MPIIDTENPRQKQKMHEVLENPSLVQLILEKVLNGSHIRMREPQLRGEQAWMLMHGSPRILSMGLVNNLFHDTMGSVKFQIAVLSLERKFNCDPYTLMDTSVPFRHLMSRCKWDLEEVRVQSIGNAFSKIGDTMACGVKESMMGARIVEIGCLDGLMALDDTHTQVMPSVSRMQISSVGHAGMVSRMVNERMFRESQSRCSGMTNEGMTNMGGIDELIVESCIPVRMEKNNLPMRIEFYFGRLGEGMEEADIGTRSFAQIASHVLEGMTIEGGGGGLCAGIHSLGETKLRAYKLRRDLGNVYLSNLDFNGVRKLRVKAYECLGPPVGYVGMSALGSGIREAKAIMHSDPYVSSFILEDILLLLGNRLGDSSHCNYYPGTLLFPQSIWYSQISHMGLLQVTRCC